MEPSLLLMWSKYGFEDLSKSGVKASVMRAGPMTLVLKVFPSWSFRVPSFIYIPALFISTSR